MTDDRRTIRNAYDNIAEAHDDARAGTAPEMPLVHDLVDDLASDAHVLDAGCGAGDPIGAFLTEHVRATGLDFSRGQLELARNRAPGMSLLQGDLTELPFDEGTFDALVSIYAVIHVPWDRHEKCFREFHRVCIDGAPILVTVGTSDWSGSQDDWMGWGAEMHWDIPGPDRTTDLLEWAGFAVEGFTRIEDVVSEEDGAKAFVRARA